VQLLPDENGLARPEESESAFSPVPVEGRAQELASPEDVVAFQERFLRLLERRTAIFTMGDSSSVPTHVAADLLRSICFVLDIDPDAPTIPARLVGVDLDAEFRRRVDEIGARVARVEQLWQRAIAEMPLIRNVALRDTLENIGEFFKRYDYRSMAHEIPCSIDYPLCHPVPESTPGVAYIEEYLSRLLIEIDFLSRFDLDTCIRLLSNSCPDYRGLLLNLYEPIATTAAGLALIGEDPRGLDITQEGRADIARLLGPLGHRGRLRVMRTAAEKACAMLGIDDDVAVAYLRDLMPELLPRIDVGISRSDLGGVFVSRLPRDGSREAVGR
jgi:hypothetical protein